EVWRGVLELPYGRRRDALQPWFAGPEGPQVLFRSRIFSFDEGVALEWARLIAEGRMLGRPRSPLDMIIAATALAHDCTANERHFDGVVEFLNPLHHNA